MKKTEINNFGLHFWGSIIIYLIFAIICVFTQSPILLIISVAAVIFNIVCDATREAHFFGWILLLPVPIFIAGLQKFVPCEITNFHKIIIMVMLVALIVTVLSILLKKKMDIPKKLSIVVLGIYLVSVLYTLNFTLDAHCMYEEKTVYKTEVFREGTWHWFYEGQELKKTLESESFFIHEYSKIIIKNGPGLFGIGYENIFVEGIE